MDVTPVPRRFVLRWVGRTVGMSVLAACLAAAGTWAWGAIAGGDGPTPAYWRVFKTLTFILLGSAVSLAQGPMIAPLIRGPRGMWEITTLGGTATIIVLLHASPDNYWPVLLLPIAVPAVQLFALRWVEINPWTYLYAAGVSNFIGGAFLLAMGGEVERNIWFLPVPVALMMGISSAFTGYVLKVAWERTFPTWAMTS